jgi:hypothetical protein
MMIEFGDRQRIKYAKVQDIAFLNNAYDYGLPMYRIS